MYANVFIQIGTLYTLIKIIEIFQYLQLRSTTIKANQVCRKSRTEIGISKHKLI